MRFAIYARRSTEEHQALSLEVQLEEAHRFARVKGWVLAEEFHEDAVSRAEFVKRPQLIRLLNAAREGRFGAVIMRDESRLGGDLYRTGMVLQELADAGVEVWLYASGERVSFDDPTCKLMAAVKLYASELERLRIASRTREHLEVRARRGNVVGGKVYGYRNVRVDEGGGRTHVEYAINETEAAVIRHIFERFAAGEGVRTIAAALNAQGVPSPRAGKRGSGSWVHSSVWSILRNERYRGALVWGARGSTYKGGTRVEVARAAEKQVRIERPELAIVTAEQWDAAHSRITRREGAFEVRRGTKPRYLLTGLLRCAQCGFSLAATVFTSGRERVAAYQCSASRNRGPTVCTNRVRRPVEEVDGSLLDWIQSNVLTESVVAATLEELRALVDRPVKVPPELGGWRRDLARLRGEVARLTDAVARTGGSDAVLAALVERERKVKELEVRVERAEASLAAERPSWEQLEVQARAFLGNLRALVARGTEGTREALHSLFVGPLRVRPIEVSGVPRFELSGRYTLSGSVGMVASPAGFEPAPR